MIETRGNHNQAPILAFKGNKENSSQKPFYQILQELADIVFDKLARKPAAIRLMRGLNRASAYLNDGFLTVQEWTIQPILRQDSF